MALPNTIIPVLTGEAAEQFNKRAEEAAANRGSVDISEMRKSVEKILARSRAKGYIK